MAEAATINFRSAQGDLYKAAASRRGLRLSDWLREAADTALKADGFSTGSPEQQYALVAGGELVTGPRGLHVLTFRPHPISEATLGFAVPADAAWVRIENRDAGQFIDGKHLRLAPLPLRVEGDVVIREYPLMEAR